MRATIAGTYNVIDEIFTGQLEHDCEKDFDGRLYLVYGDQKTVSLIRSIQGEPVVTCKLLYFLVP
jgi:uncharacterized protein DUF6589